MPKPNSFYCAICNLTLDTDQTSTAGLDSHLRTAHNHDPDRENGKADLERDSLKAHGIVYPKDSASLMNVKI